MQQVKRSMGQAFGWVVWLEEGQGREEAWCVEVGMEIITELYFAFIHYVHKQWYKNQHTYVIQKSHNKWRHFRTRVLYSES